jgi:hypothetical protein
MIFYILYLDHIESMFVKWMWGANTLLHVIGHVMCILQIVMGSIHH